MSGMSSDVCNSPTSSGANPREAPDGFTSSSAGLTRRELLGGAAALSLGSLALGVSGLPARSAWAQESQGSQGADSADSDDSLASRVFFVFDTIVTIKGAGITDEMYDELESELNRFDALFSAHSDDSDIARINAAQGEPVEVDPDTADLISRSLEVCELFDGDFDITIGSVSLLWDFVNGVKPDDDAIAEGVKHVDYHGVHVDGTTVTLDDPETKLDLGGIAKGWIADRVNSMLADWGIESAIVDLGTSSIYLRGSKPDGSAWRLGVRDPVSETGSNLCILEASDTAVATSGLYDQHFELDGVDYYHILDPRTGYPAETDMLALTAVLSDSLLSDGLTTAFFVRGIAGALDWIDSHPDYGVGALFVDRDGEVTFTEGFRDAYAIEIDESRVASDSGNANDSSDLGDADGQSAS